MTPDPGNLEQRCRDLLRAPAEEGTEGGPIVVLDREMALTLDQIQRVRDRDRQLRRQLRDRECHIESRIMNLCPRPYHIVGSEWIDRTTLINQLTGILVRIEDRYQRAAVEYDKSIHALHQRLLQLLNMREQLEPHHGHPTDSP